MKPRPTHLDKWMAEANDGVEYLEVAYAGIAASKALDVQLWNKVRKGLWAGVKATFERHGLETLPTVWEDLRKRLTPRMPQGRGQEHVEFVEAWIRDATELIYEQIEYRLSTDGNVHIAGFGPTGLTKSSCFLGLIDWMKPIKKGQVIQHVSRDLTELPGKLAAIESGDAVLLDEVLEVAGEGAQTVNKIAVNLEDTLRASGKSFFRISPRRQEQGTMQMEIEAIAWNRDEQWTLFILYVNGRPVGVAALPWCRKEVYAEYKPWKDGGTEKMVRGHFRDHALMARRANELMADEDFVDFMTGLVNKPRIKDFRTAMEITPSCMVSGTQAERLSSLMFEWCTNWTFMEQRFEKWFHAEPATGFALIAKKCYTD